MFVVSTGASLTLRNIVLTNGFSGGDAGAILNDIGGVLILENSAIRDSNAGLSGGAIVSYGPLTITNSRLEGNRALNGGALYPRFAGAATKIVNSVLRDNHATDTTTKGSEIFSNSAQYGGGIYNNLLNSSVTLNGSTLHDNTGRHLQLRRHGDADQRHPQRQLGSFRWRWHSKFQEG